MTTEKHQAEAESERRPEVHPPPATPAGDLRHLGCGFLMGAADVVPGVSGGTVALILGIYRRLVTAISRADLHFLALLKDRRLNEAADYLDLRFAGAVGLGIAAGVISLASVMLYLLEFQRAVTLATFCGLIMASVWLVARQVPEWNLKRFGLAALGCVITLRVVSLEAIQQPPESLAYTFLCGVVGISAMILPGVSGAFILLVLGRYFDILSSLKAVLKIQGSADDWLTVIVFCFGCLIGLMTISRLLRRLLARHEASTLVVLCGCMTGALYSLWPFTVDTTPHVEKFKEKIHAPFFPQTWTADVTTVLVAIPLAAAVVLLLDLVARRIRSENKEDCPSSGDPARTIPD